MSDVMDDTESLKYWLALLQAPGIGAVKFFQILEKVSSIEALFKASSSQLLDWQIPEKLRAYLSSPNWASVESALKWQNQPNNKIIKFTDAAYPGLLKDITDPPPILFVHGDERILHQPQLAVVGSRNPSRQGEQMALDFASFLAKSGFVITSGLAIGIDGASHRGALKGEGKTIAVTATGLDRVYPASHRALAHQIAEQGLLVSEFFPGTAPRPGNFPRRNRIISGLSVGTLVVEAMVKSGSLITARLASEQGREVFAIPGSIHNPLARGCHQLIKQGAKLVETASDIVAELAPMLGKLALIETSEPILASGVKLDAEYQELLDFMGFDPISVDKLVELSGLTAAEVSSMLLMLELDEYVSSSTGGFYCRIGTTE